MTYKEINTMVGAIAGSIPYAYYQFPETGIQPPFICWYIDGINDLYADNINYQGISRVVIEYYSDEKDFVTEAAIESYFSTNGHSYDKGEQYIDSEQMHETIYTLEVVINGEQSEIRP